LSDTSDATSIHLPQPQRLVVMAIFSGQKTKLIFNLIKELDITEYGSVYS